MSDANRAGAVVHAGGERLGRKGYFYPPTVLSGVPRDARLCDEEIFGPVAPLTAFETEADAIAAANDTEYGLVSYVFTNDLRRVKQVLETGELVRSDASIHRGMHPARPAAPTEMPADREEQP